LALDLGPIMYGNRPEQGEQRVVVGPVAGGHPPRFPDPAPHNQPRLQLDATAVAPQASRDRRVEVSR
jgi:hypothetical protein